MNVQLFNGSPLLKHPTTSIHTCVSLSAYPFLLNRTLNFMSPVSQCQAIHARSVFPCQDTPDVKSTFAFKFRSSLPVLASGLSDGIESIEGSDEKFYKFKQDVPIPSYLFAVASGDIVGADIGPRSKVWTGPDEIEGAKWELERDTEKFIETAEKIIYPYAWGTYNVLVLPPSFPYGGKPASKSPLNHPA